MKKTLIIGATANPSRYAYLAAQRLFLNGYDIELLGRRKGEVFGHNIHTEKIPFENIDTVTMYVSEENQPEYYDYILSLKPKRVIFNPGAENREFTKLLDQNNIEWEEACTLVMLGAGQY